MKPRLHAAAELSPAVVAIMLSGWGATPPTGESQNDGVFALAGNWGVAEPRPDEDGAFSLFEGRDAGICRVWQRHEAYLRAEAHRLGIAPAWSRHGRRMFFGEYVTALQGTPA